MKRISTRSPQETWSNRGFHLFLFLLITFFGLTMRLVKVSAENVHVVKQPPTVVVKAAETNPLISPLVISTPTPQPVRGKVLEKDRERWNAILIAIDKVAPLYNAERVKKVIKSQAALESGVHSDKGLSDLCLQRWNCLGINATDSDPNGAYYFENAEQMVIGYFERVIRPNFSEAWKVKSIDPDQYLYFLKYTYNGKYYASDPDYAAKVKSQPEWSEQ